MWRVRLAAVKAMVHLTEPGDELVIAALGALLEDDDWIVKVAAVRGMADFAEKGYYCRERPIVTGKWVCEEVSRSA